MSENDNVGVNQDSVDESEGRANKDSLSRRNFLKKSALVSAPIIMTIASGPVWARNCTMSGRLSGNLSEPGDPCPPAACSPGYWKQVHHLGSWSVTLPYTPASDFYDAFGVVAFPAGTTLLQAINKTVVPVDPPSSCSNIDQLKNALAQLAFHAVAALQNSLTLGTLGYPHNTTAVIFKFREGFDAFNACNLRGIVVAKNDLEAPYLGTHFCPFGNDGSNSDKNLL